MRLLGSREARKEAVRDAGSTVVAVAGKCAQKGKRKGYARRKVEVNEGAAVFR